MITLDDMLKDAGTNDVSLLGHSFIYVDPNYVGTLDGGLHEKHWARIRDQVREHIRAHLRGGVHALPDGRERIETDEEWDYNEKHRNAVRKPVRKGKYDDETLTQRTRKINEVKAAVRKAATARAKEKAARKAARLYYRLWGEAPWDTRQSILDGSFSVVEKPEVDHDNARENQKQANDEHAHEAYLREIERIGFLEQLDGAIYNDLRAEAERQLQLVLDA